MYIHQKVKNVKKFHEFSELNERWGHIVINVGVTDKQMNRNRFFQIQRQTNIKLKSFCLQFT